VQGLPSSQLTVGSGTAIEIGLIEASMVDVDLSSSAMAGGNPTGPPTSIVSCLGFSRVPL
jgi:hypothetical protein